MRQVKFIITVVVVVCVSLANTEVLWAIHIHQHGGCLSACDPSRPGEKQRPVGHHDSDKCPFCIQSGSAKTVPLGFTDHISFTTGSAEQAVLIRAFLYSAVLLPSSSPRAPPSISL